MGRISGHPLNHCRITQPFTVKSQPQRTDPLSRTMTASLECPVPCFSPSSRLPPFDPRPVTGRSDLRLRSLGDASCRRIPGGWASWKQSPVTRPHKFYFVFQCVCCCLVAKLCLVLCDPMWCSPPGFSVHGISQARIPDWVAISSSRESSQPRDHTPVP